MIFSHWNLKRIAIRGTGGRKYEVFHPKFNHDIKKIQRVDHIIPIIFSRMIDGLAYITKSAIMHDRLDRIGLEAETQLIFVCQVSQNEMAPFGKFPMAAAQIVIDNRFVASFIEDFISVGTDVPGAASDKDHVLPPF